MKDSTTNTFDTANSNAMLGDGFLIPMTDFVIEYAPKFNPFGTDEQILCLDYIHNYAKFLKQTLKLEMFVPCVDGSPIEYFELKKTGGKFCQVGSKIEKEAKGKILFEDFELISETDETWLFKINGNFPRIVGKKLTIESLRIFKDKIKLSQSALNAIFGKTIA